MDHRRRARKSRRKAAGSSVLVAIAIGLGACGGGGSTQAGTAAAAVTPFATTPPVVAGAAPTVPQPATTQPGASQPAATQPAATQARPTTPATPRATTAPTAAAAPRSTGAPAPALNVPAPTIAALAARRQPTAAEINQVISGVHALVPLFTLTPAQIAQAGDQVCTAFDQGRSLAEVKAAMVQMAGAYAALIPPGATDSALRTIVTIYCPGYVSKLV